ncbi:MULTISPECIES: DNA starvation/stationary phase protection protein Dps [Thalassoglobus]|uniref:DNA protection during starvation protein n=1 Tax=Thalassoglobus polymorphus TaxID=2527994 RepID=A0A517QSZ6_9PLAN|nr:DNA starvation/stationary phase protection protein Dps [Thalassoglobus polymorphus]QDT34765.1 DNA protection during starvation protein [Thalassoglobus polymorphus]
MSTVTSLNYQTHNDISEETRESMIELLNQHLADTFDLYTQVKQSHWNVKGMNFMQLHLLFDDLAENFIRYADMIAERATALGGRAEGTARMAANNSRIEELPIELTDGKDFLIAMANRFGEYAALSRIAIDKSENLNDAVTCDLFTEITREVDKSLYFLESHLQSM